MIGVFTCCNGWGALTVSCSGLDSTIRTHLGEGLEEGMKDERTKNLALLDGRKPQYCADNVHSGDPESRHQYASKCVVAGDNQCENGKTSADI